MLADMILKRIISPVAVKSFLGALILLTGCAAEIPTDDGPSMGGDPGIRQFLWNCGTLGRLVTKWQGQNTIEVMFNGKSWRLPRAISASGERYSDGQREAWEHQGTLRWSLADGTTTRCHQIHSKVR